MTATAPPRRAPGAGPAPAPPRRPVSPGVRRTAQALLGAALGVIPLKGIFSDWAWLADVWISMLVVLGPAMWLRRRRPPGALDIWPGIILLVPWLTLRFVSEHAVGGLIPTAATMHQVSSLLGDLHDTTANSVAPIHSTVAVKLVLCALLGLLAALIDLIAVVGHRGALAGVPLLVVYTVSGAVPREPVSWVWFVFSAAGFLLLLGLDAGDELDRWGRRFRSPRRPTSTARWAVSAPRIVVTALVLAVLAPLLVPGQSRNLIANAFHGSNGNGVGGFGGSGGGSISPFAALKGQLDRPSPVSMARVHISGGAPTQPFYLRVNVLERYTGDGWQVADHGDQVSVDANRFDTVPQDGGAENSVSMQAQISITGLRGNAPVFTQPVSINGLTGGTWAPKDQILLGDKVTKGQTYVENFEQSAPTANQLTAATGTPGAELADDLQLPGNFPSYAHQLVEKLTKGLSSPYQQARAIHDYFTNPANGFVYNLKTKPGDSGSALVDFLRNKQGYCQQYAAAMAVMLRDAKVPARVVLGYMHEPADASGNFTVTSAEAHSWVEAYFSGIGWIPFDPTPAAGLVGGTKTDLPWAPHPNGSSGQAPANGIPQKSAGSSASTSPTPTSAAPKGAQPQAESTGSGTSTAPLWWALGAIVVLALVLTPAAVRAGRRRRRLTHARRAGDADALWAELSDTAVDLGYVWSSARSPRQVAGWLGGAATGSAGSLQELAAAVERGRYSGPGSHMVDERALERGLRDVTGDLRAGRSLSTRLRSRLWPASLGWGPPARRRGSREA
ncbi:transglutaminaseTgpA domain-containing protein [uncultured Jatrophihabitans sp.]|uniref:transglutaminase family protein n=1 Tax=uncultured Jatrophihabitans sp. TaxID=1610747 RepID=UPI0035CB0DC0